MKDTKLEIVEVETESLLEYENNAKIHTAEQVDQIAASIEEFGNCDPIAVWHDKDGQAVIVEGHGRLMALKKLGVEKCPVIFLDHLTDEQRRAYTHIHNKLNMNTGLDMSVLSMDINELDIDWDEFGFDAVDLADARGITDDFNNDFTDEELSAYSEESPLKAYNVILCCLTEEEQEYVAGLLGVEGQPKRLYMVSELMNG